MYMMNLLRKSNVAALIFTSKLFNFLRVLALVGDSKKATPKLIWDGYVEYYHSENGKVLVCRYLLNIKVD